MAATTNTKPKPRKIPSSACFNYILGKPPGGSYVITSVRPVKPTAARNKKPAALSATVKKDTRRDTVAGGVCDLVADDVFSVDEVCWLFTLFLETKVLFETRLTRLLRHS